MAAFVCEPFDAMQFPDFRFLDLAARETGPVDVWLWSDALITSRTGAPPKFPEAERTYLLQSLRSVRKVTLAETPLPDPKHLPERNAKTWIVRERADTPERRAFCRANDLALRVVPDARLQNAPPVSPHLKPPTSPDRKKVIVTGCYDWFHSGHVAFFEEASSYGDLYVVVGNDANVRLLKGEGHPMFPQERRRYIVASVRFVHQALISTGSGWMDAAPEIERIRPDVYIVNEDGDKPEKRAFCASHGLEYLVLKRLPKPGLPRRESTQLRGF